jgi:hypothetical protein
MAYQEVRHRPNILFYLAALVLIVAGAGLAIYGFATAVQSMMSVGPSMSRMPVKIVDGMAQGFWGVFVATIGAYLWRGARKRGAADRFGRLLIVGGYILIGVALDRGLHSAADLWSTGGDQDEIKSIMIHTMIIICLWGFSGAALATIGFRLAHEKAITTVEVTGEF